MTGNGLAVVPAPRRWVAGEGKFRLSPETTLMVDPHHTKVLEPAANSLRAGVETIAGVKLAPHSSGTNKNVFIIGCDPKNSGLGEEGYVIHIMPDAIALAAAEPAGAYYAVQTLLQMLRTHGQSLPCGAIEDRPAFEDRGLMIDCGRKYWEMSYLEDLIRQMGWYKLNTLHLHFTEWNAFRLVSDTYPGLAAEQAYTKADIRRLEAVARANHVTIVPEIDLPAHATVISRYNPSLGFKCLSMRKGHQGPEVGADAPSYTLDITRKEVRHWIRALLEEFVPAFEGPYFHMGGDEWPYDVDKLACPELVAAMQQRGYPYPTDVFVEWINEVNKQIRSHGKQAQLWTWWSFCPDEKRKNETSLVPDEDILINVWNEQLLKQILAEGYEAIYTPEERLYVAPGHGPKVGDYGYMNANAVYTSPDFNPERLSEVMGLKVCVWSDKMETAKDEELERYLVRPRAVLAERTWSGATNGDASAFFERVKTVGNAPGTKAIAALDQAR